MPWPERDVPISGHKGGHTYCALDLSESLSIEPSQQTLVRSRNVDAINVDGPLAQKSNTFQPAELPVTVPLWSSWSTWYERTAPLVIITRFWARTISWGCRDLSPVASYCEIRALFSFPFMILYQLSDSHPLVALVLLSFSIAVFGRTAGSFRWPHPQPSPLHS